MVDPVKTVHVAGMTLHPLTVPQIVNEIVLRSLTGERLLLANHNLHSLYLMQRSKEIRKFYGRAERTIIDGAPILRMAQKKRSDLTNSHRVGSTDWLGALLHAGNESNLRIALLGGAPGVAARARDEESSDASVDSRLRSATGSLTALDPAPRTSPFSPGSASSSLTFF